MSLFSNISGAGIRLAVATTLLCGATMGGYMALTTDDGLSSPSPAFVPMPTHSAQGASYSPSGAGSYSGTAVSTVQHSSLMGMGGGGVGAASAPVATFSSVNTGAGGTGLTLATWSPAGGAGGGGGSSSAGASGGGSTGGTMGLMSGGGGGGGSVAGASAPRRSSPAPLSEPGALNVYTGNTPGVITQSETEELDNPIVTSYGQPIGDAILPLILFAMAYCGWIFKKRIYADKKQ